MEHLLIFSFVLIIIIIALCKWNAMQYEKIKDLKHSIYILNKEHNDISKENTSLREFIKMQDLLIKEMNVKE